MTRWAYMSLFPEKSGSFPFYPPSMMSEGAAVETERLGFQEIIFPTPLALGVSVIPSAKADLC